MIFKNENVIEDLIDIMLQLHNYVPTEHHTAVDERVVAIKHHVICYIKFYLEGIS